MVERERERERERWLKGENMGHLVICDDNSWVLDTLTQWTRGGARWKGVGTDWKRCRTAWGWRHCH